MQPGHKRRFVSGIRNNRDNHRFALGGELQIVKSTFVILVFLATCLLAADFSSAQTVAAEPYIVESYSSGEISSSEIDSILREARQDGERLFVIVRLGTG